MKGYFKAFAASITLLTRIPLPLFRGMEITGEQLAHSSVFFPAVGLFFGLMSYILYLLMLWLKAGPDMTAFVILAFPYVLNRFFHFDGLCDCLDAFLTDKPAEQRLMILKDSRTGSFALGGGVLYLLLKFLLLKSLILNPSLIVMITVIPVLSRYSMDILAFRSRYPREKGTGAMMIGKISGMDFILSGIVCISALAGLYFFLPIEWPFLVLALAGSVLAALLLKAYSYRKIGGVTGDVLGAGSELAEIVVPALVLLLWKAGVR